MERYNDATAWARVKNSMRGDGPWFKARAPIPNMKFVDGWPAELKAKLQHHQTPKQAIIDPWYGRRNG